MNNKFQQRTNFNENPCYNFTKVWWQYRQYCLLATNLFRKAGFRIRAYSIGSGSMRIQSDPDQGVFNRIRILAYSNGSRFWRIQSDPDPGVFKRIRICIWKKVELKKMLRKGIFKEIVITQ